MRKLVLSGFSLWILVALAWAGDPWKDKAYQQWDKGDVQRILNDSPWVKVAYIDMSGASLSDQSGLSSGNPGASPRAMAGKAGVGGGGAAPGATPGEIGGGTSPNPPQIPFVVRWISSRTIREALVRNGELSGQVKEADAAKDLSTPAETYEVVVFGPQMDVFGAATESTLKENVFFTCKKTKEKIAPATVNMERTPDGKTIRAIIFSFPKQTAAGEPTIASTEKTVEFSCTLPRVKFKVSFDLPRMEDSKGRDL
jgi:hypothetical protein